MRSEGESGVAAGRGRGKAGTLYIWVIVAIAAGIALGHWYPDAAVQFKPLGDLFIKLVKLVIAPVIFLTIVTGIAGMKSLGELGNVALKAFGYFIVVSTFALVFGMVAAKVTADLDAQIQQPGTSAERFVRQVYAELAPAH